MADTRFENCASCLKGGRWQDQFDVRGNKSGSKLVLRTACLLESVCSKMTRSLCRGDVRQCSNAGCLCRESWTRSTSWRLTMC